MLAAALLAPSAHAADIDVDVLTDNGGPGCELREAIASANTAAPVGGCTTGEIGPDTINITAPGTITLLTATGGELPVASNITVVGLGVGTTTITHDPVSRIFHVQSIGVLRLESLQVSGGTGNLRGAGILNEGGLTLDQAEVSGNAAIGMEGGGIAGESNSSTTIMNSEVSGNVAGEGGGGRGGGGGGIYIEGGTLTVESSLIHGNTAKQFGMVTSLPEARGGGIYAASGIGPTTPTVTISNSQIGSLGNGNVAELSGGGLWMDGGNLQVRNTLVVDNQAQGDGGAGHGGGAGLVLLDVSGVSHDQLILNSTITGNDGGGAGAGLFSNVEAPNQTEIEGTTFSANVARTGGGLSLFGRATILNSTISGNSATLHTGAMAVSGSGGAGTTHVNLSNSTIAGNQSPSTSGISFGDDGGDTLNLGTSVLENPAGGGQNCFGPITSAGYNVVSDNTCALGGTGDAEGVSPMLGGLADNGGPHAGIPPGDPIETHALLPGSPAIDRSPTGPPTDQRGVSRPQGAFFDSGAFELEMAIAPGPTPPPPPPSIVPLAVPPSNAFELGRLKRNKKKGIAFLFVNVPGPGEVGLAGKGVKNVGIAAATARKSVFTPGGVVKLRIKPGKGKKARKLVSRLKSKGKAKLKVRVTYVPTGGVANSLARKLKLVRKR
jgi:hypothetical protein